MKRICRCKLRCAELQTAREAKKWLQLTPPKARLADRYAVIMQPDNS